MSECNIERVIVGTVEPTIYVRRADDGGFLSFRPDGGIWLRDRLLATDTDAYRTMRKAAESHEAERRSLLGVAQHYARQLLLRVMREWSERWCGVEWTHDTDRKFWAWCNGETNGGYWEDTPDRPVWRQLVEDSGGLWVWDEDSGREAFVPMEEWERTRGGKERSEAMPPRSGANDNQIR